MEKLFRCPTNSRAADFGSFGKSFSNQAEAVSYKKAGKPNVVTRRAISADLYFSCRTSEGEGLRLFLDRAADRIQLGRASYHPDYGWSELFGDATTTCAIELDRNYHLLCFAPDEHFESYLDDRWLVALASDQAASSGDVELFVERDAASFTNIRVGHYRTIPIVSPIGWRALYRQGHVLICPFAIARSDPVYGSRGTTSLANLSIDFRIFALSSQSWAI